MSPNQPHPSLALSAADRCLWLGSVDAASPRMRGDLWVVFHGKAGWTHLYRVDGRDPRTVHLVRCGEGDCRATLAAWARRHLIDDTKASRRAGTATGAADRDAAQSRRFAA